MHMTEVLSEETPLGRRRQFALTIATRLSGASHADARRIEAWLQERESETETPADFQSGRSARCLAFLQIERARPMLFWGSLISIFAIPLLVASKFGGA
jgi:hypothetical protein